MTPEWSRIVVLANIPAEGERIVLEAEPAARAALARRLGLVALHGLRAGFSLHPGLDGRVAVRGTLEAEVEQACVVSLAPVRQSLREEFAWRLLPQDEEPSDGDDDPDDIASTDGGVDLAEELAQQLSLALDPYPRAPDAVLPDEAGDGNAHGPFAALARLRRPR